MNLEAIKNGLNVDIQKIHLLDKFIDVPSGRIKGIKDYLKKINHKPQAKNYREGSDKWEKALAEDKEIAQISDLDVKEVGEITIRCSYLNKSFTVMSLTVMVESYDYDTHYTKEYKETYYFLTNFGGYTKYYCLEDILRDRDIVEMLAKHFNSQIFTEVYDMLEDFEDGHFMLLKDKIIKAKQDFIKVTYYVGPTPHIVIGDEEFTYEEMTQINHDYKNKTVFYDESDTRVDYYSGYDSYVDFHRKWAPKESKTQ